MEGPNSHKQLSSSFAYGLYSEFAANDISAQISVIQNKASAGVKKIQKQTPEKSDSLTSKKK